MAYYIRKKKVVDECDGGCDAGCGAPMTDMSPGMGNVIPGSSGDRFDNVLGYGFSDAFSTKKKRKHKIYKRKVKR